MLMQQKYKSDTKIREILGILLKFGSCIQNELLRSWISITSFKLKCTFVGKCNLFHCYQL